MERRLGHDFNQVRVHADGAAAASAQAVGAIAYTVGQHIVFGSGQYAPETRAGRRLLAHELAHVAQQAEGRLPTDATDAARLEHDAERSADTASDASRTQTRAPRSLPIPSRVALQRYAVPAELPCNEVVDWLNSNSPFSPEWAATSCDISISGDVQTQHRTLPGGQVQVTARGHRGITASVSCPIERPEWDPSPRANRVAEVAAWRAMRRTLDAHEQRHRGIGAQWRGTLESRYRAISFSVTGADLADAQGQASQRVADLEAGWRAEAQAAQSAIDPFRGANLACP